MPSPESTTAFSVELAEEGTVIPGFKEKEQILTQRPAQFAGKAVEAHETETIFGFPSLPQTPAPSGLTGINWPGPRSSSGLFPPDPQISVSGSHVVVTTNDVVAFYDKNGTLLQAIAPTGFLLSILVPPTGDLPAGIDTVFDLRTIFDSYRNRFWVGALALNSAHSADEGRLTKFVVAVSQTENPFDGWHLYWWDAVANDGLPNDPIFKPGDAGDYPCLGIDNTGFFQTNAVANVLSHEYRYWLVNALPANLLASGVLANGSRRFDLTNPDGTPALLIQPSVHHGPNPRTYLASRVLDAGNRQILVWSITNLFQTNEQVTRVEVTLQPFGPTNNFAPQAGSSQRIQMDNLGSNVMKAVFRSDKLYLITHDAKDWFNDGRVLSSLRLVRLNVANYPHIPAGPADLIDRVFGANNPFTDQPTDHFHYGWPAVEVNKFGDIVLVFARSGTTIFPEARLSIRFADEADIRPSRLLKPGEVPYGLDYAETTGNNELRWGDTAGASVDPSDDTAVWVTQAYASDHRSFQHNNWALWVGKLALNVIAVPDCTDLALEEAQSLLESAGLIIGTVVTLPPPPPPGTLGPPLVIDQAPLAGIEVKRGSRVDLQLQRERFPPVPRF
ncbi:MAG TPA: PASTA domain-containing protein [Pyrinomonadaceae bacterium]|nr:PASTA domain-containing protein [Pyrinomonadaceae bacterium]